MWKLDPMEIISALIMVLTMVVIFGLYLWLR
jgi:hypothetical protein